MKKYSIIGYRRHIGGNYSVYQSYDSISLSKALYLAKQWFADVEKYGFIRDFLKTDFIGSIILTNPPYSLATEFAEHALEILPDGGLYIALMNITYLAGQDRYKRLYSKNCLRELYVFSKRIECRKNNIPSGHSSIANYAWYVFQKNYNGQPTIYWL